ncbi:hypothetical protein TSTA_060790 [Talaromyces stipitatus ATCC 10500]|uniref:HTH CENPB-type domain-containing protein n=1 Tax=Talaromyces stipitatus (strain ATCC 10500 / CBS 375.48 / QM 6759 / NRRL 1006) TaxID=441959 RepID=B8LUW6_TALSN|nr:uncharacterized protein TSTA_060790 [Talaromyces stipitatus ATCC 10500]EED22587.1 hypothetical protein TSTA_060790 [Talaromyces stipitatus ATCC 10500]
MVNKADILKAISDLKAQKKPQYAKIAGKYNIDRTTLMRRYKGQTVSNQEAHSIYQKLLTNAQEEVLLDHISRLSARGLPPTPQILRNIVKEIIGHDISECWLAEKIKKYCISPSNIYNFDVKGFIIGICCTRKRIVSIYQLRSKKLLGSNQDGSRKFISLLACICADGKALPPSRIYQGESRDLQANWLEDFDSSRLTSESIHLSQFWILKGDKAGVLAVISRGVAISFKLSKYSISLCFTWAIQQEEGDLTQATKLVMKAAQKLIIRNEILEHQYKGLVNALVNEKNRQRRGMPLGLIDKENPGEAQFFSLSKVEAAKQRIRDIEAQKEQDKINAAILRTQKALERERRDRENQEKRESRIREREAKKQQKELEKEQRHIARETKKQAKHDQKMQESQIHLKRRRSKRVTEGSEDVSSKKQKIEVTRLGREINLPVRFRD